MDTQEQAELVADLSDYTSVGDWQSRFGGEFFPTESAIQWFIKNNRKELVECGALIVRQGRAGSLLSIKEFPKATLRIFRRKALEKAA
jgi:hypothetical protein